MTSPAKPARRFNSRSTAREVLKGVDLSGRTIAITGTTNGIGLETARALALANAHVVMLCRNTRAADEVRVKILAEKVNSFVSRTVKTQTTSIY
jgi:NAD(P)-dependent dehydrogenase (short-subunit alcohol dehydrogenase family)